MRFALAIFFLLPILEITGFVVVGRYLGVAGTIGLTILTGLLGTLLLRTQGVGALRRLNTERLSPAETGREIVNGLMIAVAGLLLIIPGFVTDTVGLLLLLPPVRQAAWKLARRRFTVVSSTTGGYRSSPPPNDPPNRSRDDSDGPIIDLDEGEYRRRPDASPTNPDTASRRIDGDRKL